MRLLYPLFSWLLQYSIVNGFAQAPGIYPAEETKESDLTVPKNPYQSGWTGYEFYYEKDGAKKGSNTAFSTSEGFAKPKNGLKPFKPIGPVDNELELEEGDRENGEDPNLGEHIPSAHSTSSNQNIETEVSPSSTTGMYYETTKQHIPNSTPTTTAVVSSTNTPTPTTKKTNFPPGTEPKAPETSVVDSPQSGGDDLSAIDNGIGYDLGDSSTLSSTHSTPTSAKPQPKTSTSTPQAHQSTNKSTALPYDSSYGNVLNNDNSLDSTRKSSAETSSYPSTASKIQGIKLMNSHSTLLLTTSTTIAPSTEKLETLNTGNNFENGTENRIKSIPDDLWNTNKIEEWKIPFTLKKDLNNGTKKVTPAVKVTTNKSTLHFPNKPLYTHKNDTLPLLPSFAPPPSSLLFGPTSPREKPSTTLSVDPVTPQALPPLSISLGPNASPVNSSLSLSPDFIAPQAPISPSLSLGSVAPRAPPSPSQRLTFYKPHLVEFIKGFEDEKAYESNTAPIVSIDQGNQIGNSNTHPKNELTRASHTSHDSSIYNTQGHSHSLVTPSPNPIPTLIPNYGTTQDFGDFVGGYPDKDIAAFNKQPRRESVDYGHQEVTGDSTKDVVVETSVKKYGRSSRKCCSCCDEKQPVNREIQTEIEPSDTIQQIVDPTKMTSEYQNDPETEQVGGNAYIQRPQQPSQPVLIPQDQGNIHVPITSQTYAQNPFQQYQPQYPQSYPQQNPGCPCQTQKAPQNCCPPPQPCCMPQIPCCPTIPCCPSRTICCQPQPVCPPPPTCCQINFQLPTIPICGRSCPSCPCRRRVHKARRLKRHSLGGSCNQCSQAGEPWKTVLHREKRFASGCSGGASFLQSSCGQCGSSNLRSARVKRMGCLPCLGRKKRETEEVEDHVRVKRMGCLPCLGRKKRSALSSSNCSSCSNLGQIFGRYKRSLLGGCSPCGRKKREVCPCQSQLTRGKRDISVMKTNKRTLTFGEVCDSSCCDYTACRKQKRMKKETLVPFLM